MIVWVGGAVLEMSDESSTNSTFYLSIEFKILILPRISDLATLPVSYAFPSV